jgi:hypothetical protein
LCPLFNINPIIKVIEPVVPVEEDTNIEDEDMLSYISLMDEINSKTGEIETTNLSFLT